MSEFFGPNEWFVSRPLAELGIFALGILLLDYWLRRRRPGLTPLLALLGVGFAAIPTRQIQLAVRQAPLQAFDGALRVDNFAVYFWFLFLAAAGVAVLTSYRFLEIEEEPQGEYYALLLFSVIGMFVLAAADELIVAFLGLEVMSLALYVLVGYLRRDRRSNEAALKYLLLGA
ncbi:MAG: proton-conducting transporter transmembrane domain-containing protein, partial [Terriglobales bacterium]